MSPSRSVAALLIPALVLVAACGSDDSSSATTRASTIPASTTIADATTTVAADTTAAGTTASAPPSTPASSFPVTITNRLGEVTIPAKPERIVALGYNDVDVVYGLGLKPVGAAANTVTGGLSPWLEGTYSADGVQFLNALPQLSIEAVAALHPDVILASPFATIDDTYAQLSAIAPVVADTNGVLTDTWQERTRKIGVALGMPDEAEALVERGEADLAAVAERFPRLAGKTYTLSWARSADQVVVMAADDITSQMFGELGLTIPETVLAMHTQAAGAGAGGATVTMETIGQLDADLMVVAFNSDGGRATFESNPVFAAVPAIADGRYQAVDIATIGAFRAPTVFSIGWAFGQLEPLFEKVTA